jgi:hypothetical protein
VEIFAPLKPFEQWPAGLTKEKLTKQLQQEFTDELPGVVFNFSQYIQDNIEEAISGVQHQERTSDQPHRCRTAGDKTEPSPVAQERLSE